MGVVEINFSKAGRFCDEYYSALPRNYAKKVLMNKNIFQSAFTLNFDPIGWFCGDLVY